MLGYGNTTVSGLAFHSRFTDNAVENVSLLSLTKDVDFINKSSGLLSQRDSLQG